MADKDLVTARKNQGIRLNKVLDALNTNPSEFYRDLGFKRGYDSYSQVIKGEYSLSGRFFKALEEKFPEINPDYLKVGRGGIWKNPTVEIKGVPYFGSGDIQIMESYFETYALPQGFSRMIAVPLFTNIFAYVSNHQETMGPIINSGDVIALSLVKDINSIQYGSIFYINVDGQYLLYYVKKGTGKKLNLVPENPKFDPITISQDQITRAFSVKGVISRLS